MMGVAALGSALAIQASTGGVVGLARVACEAATVLALPPLFANALATMVSGMVARAFRIKRNVVGTRARFAPRGLHGSSRRGVDNGPAARSRFGDRARGATSVSHGERQNRRHRGAWLRRAAKVMGAQHVRVGSACGRHRHRTGVGGVSRDRELV